MRKERSKRFALAELTKFERWKEVERAVRRVQKISHSELTEEESFLVDFRLTLGMFCPRYNFTRDSVQKRLVLALGPHAKEVFQQQEAIRLFRGFEAACEFTFGGNWRAYPERLMQCQVLQNIEMFRSAPELLGGHDKVLADALVAGDVSFFEKVAKRLRVPQSARTKGASELPALDIGNEICRNWTNPDFPMWLMMDRALKQTIRYLTGGQFLDGRAIHQRISRFGFNRHQRRPIKALSLTKDRQTGMLLFGEYAYAAYLRHEMHGVVVCKGYGETGVWRAGRQSDKDDGHL